MIGLDPAASERLCLTLLHSLWQIALLAGIAWWSGFVLGRRRVNTSYVVHVGALVLGLIALPITHAMIRLPSDTAPRVASVAPATTAFPPLPDTDPAPSTEAFTSEAGPTPGPIAAAPPARVAPPAPKALPASHFAWQRGGPWLASAYLAGVGVMLARLARSALRLERLRSAAQPIVDGPVHEAFAAIKHRWFLRTQPALMHAERVVVPKVVGLLKPTILLPSSALTGLPIDELELILAHELAHVRRHDLWINLLQRLAEAVLFFNPVLWWLSHRIGTLREYRCDDLACVVMSDRPEPKLRYAEALLHTVELQSSDNSGQLAALAVAGRSPSELRRRIARLFGEPLHEPFKLSRKGTLALILAAGTLGVGYVASATASRDGIGPPTAKQEQASEDLHVSLSTQPNLPAPRHYKPTPEHTVVTYYGVTDRLTQDRIANHVLRTRAERGWPPARLVFKQSPPANTSYWGTQYGSVPVNETPTLREVLVDNSYTSPPGVDTITLQANFADQAAALVARILRSKPIPFCNDQGIAEIQKNFAQDLQQVFDSGRVDLGEVPAQRRADILTALRDNGPHHLRMVTPPRSQDYLEFPDSLQTLQWKILMALDRGKLSRDQEARREQQRQWMLSLPETIGGGTRREQAEVIAELHWRFRDPLMTLFDRPLSGKQFTEFQRLVKLEIRKALEGFRSNDGNEWVNPHNPLPWLTGTMHGLILSSGVAEQWGISSSKPSFSRFDDQEIFNHGVTSFTGLRGTIQGALDLRFDANRLHRGRGGSLGNFFHYPSDVLSVSDGKTVQVLHRLWKHGDPKIVLDDLQERGEGDLVYDGERPEFVGIRGAKLLRLDATSWHEADTLSNRELRRRLKSYGSERLDLKEVYEKKRRELSQGNRHVFFGVLNHEGELAVIQIEYFSGGRGKWGRILFLTRPRSASGASDGNQATSRVLSGPGRPTAR